MAQTGVRITGLRETIAALTRLGSDAQDLDVAMGSIGDRITGEGGRLAPVESGLMSGSITAVTTANRTEVTAGGGGIPYARVIHDGWPGHNIEPHPFLLDAANQNQATAVRDVEANLRTLISRNNLT